MPREVATWRASSPEALAEIVANDPDWPYCDMCGEDRVAVKGTECGYCFDCADKYIDGDRMIPVPESARVKPEDVTVECDKNEGSILVKIRGVNVVSLVVHELWNGTDDYWFDRPDDENVCRELGFAIGSWDYSDIGGRFDEPPEARIADGQFFTLWAQPLPLEHA